MPSRSAAHIAILRKLIGARRGFKHGVATAVDAMLVFAPSRNEIEEIGLTDQRGDGCRTIR